VAINTVGSFSNYQNHDQYIANAETAENVMSKIQEAIESARLFNSREFAVGKE
jgi:hypothetical protein